METIKDVVRVQVLDNNEMELVLKSGDVGIHYGTIDNIIIDESGNDTLIVTYDTMD